ncbi:MAG: alkaline phosphatase family protein [Proteobacteria bacterium]|nr:alkaline phosphatase family protein [Pseudomonadota bacterium]
MSRRVARHVGMGLSLLCVTLCCVAQAQPSTPLKTRNVVLIVSDGLRWQEIFTGADEQLLNEKNGGIWDSEKSLRAKYWRADPAERRKALFPFLWSTVAVQGQIFGNQNKGSTARVTNGLAFSYPGYNEMLTGHPDPRINSNEFGPNPNTSVFEWLNGLPELHGRVAAYATWETFKDIFNVKRSALPVHAGWDPPYSGTLDPRQQLLTRLYQTMTRFDAEDNYDAFIQIPLLDSFATQQPHVLFVGYGETDDWAHAGRYDLLLHAAHRFDQFVAELWNKLQGMAEYKDQTTFIITCDHGRGSGPTDWKEHGIEQKGSENVWIAVIGPDTAPLGERSNVAEVHQAQIAATLAALLGKDYPKAQPLAAAPIMDVVGTSH